LTYISQFDLLERVNIENGIYQMFNICCPTLGILEKVASNIANIPYPTKAGNTFIRRTFFIALHSYGTCYFLSLV